MTTGPELRERFAKALPEGRTLYRDQILDRVVEVAMGALAETLTREERTGLAAYYGFEVGQEEAAVEMENLRRMLVDAGVRDADENGVRLPVIRMVENVLRTARPT